MRFLQYAFIAFGFIFGVFAFSIMMSPASVAVGTGLSSFGFFLTAAVPSFICFVAADCFRKAVNCKPTNKRKVQDD